MVPIFTVLKARPTLEKVRRLCVEHFRPLQAVIADEPATEADRLNLNLWPQFGEALPHAGTKRLRFGFTGQALPEERTWQLLFVKFIAMRGGHLRRFPQYDFPLRRCFPCPSPGRVPYWAIGEQDICPILIDELWQPTHLFDEEALPERLEPFVSDRFGFPSRSVSENQRVISDGFPSNVSFAPAVRKELERLNEVFRL